MYFEIFKQGNLIIRGKQILNTISLDVEPMIAPSTTFVLPIDYLKVLDGREEIKIFLDECRVFWGIVWDIDVNKENETVELDVRHVITEWQYRQISVNHAISNEDLNIVYVGDKTKKSTENNETLTASNFTVVNASIDKMSIADWVDKAHASAWVTSNGDKVAITSVDTSKIKEKKDKYEEGTYKVKFSTAKGTSVTVDCEVVDEIDLESRKSKTNKENKETISAVPFTVYTTKNMTVEQAKKKANPKAWVYKNKKEKVEVTSITTDFDGTKAGEYELTASTAKGTKITIDIEVKDGQGEYNVLDDPAVVDKLEDIYSDMNFAYPGWQIDFQDGSENEKIDYVYSRQNKLEALTKTMELTENLFWRVGLWNEKRVEIGEFGDIKPYTISTKPSGETNIRMLTEPTIDYDFENVINVATIYSDKSDGGMSSLTLREVYQDPSLQKPEFPVVILHANANNERDYTKYISQFPKIAPNNEIEYAIIDTESVALESGTIIEGTFSFNDYSPFQIDGKVISDKKRIKAAQTVYNSGIRILKQLRRSYSIRFATEPIPCDLEVCDKVRFLYSNRIWEQAECSSYWKKILSYDDYFYISRIEYEYDSLGNLINWLTLTKWIKIERETQNLFG